MESTQKLKKKEKRP